ncbi:hypothetical protein F4821DRAFT_85485 [Hypoxylon rubiginosum]|uniref:Uncharacterized protein n=1 Tax=Hypoxylon rubiginosum TaxID=110542 RepID=A0ACC0D7I9_9PEZI|nr:hypothetical protein F4821DRAFT_85485 [Hypoxylon rubiginosum]
MSLSSPTPSLLLTKRLTAFLNSNLSAQIHTAALTTPSGKLLAHASPRSVGVLRTQCTVAASIWAQYSSPAAAAAVEESLPQHQQQQQTQQQAQQRYADRREPPSPGAITIQLAAGVVVIRRLRCGLLFVCVGPSAAAVGGSGSDSGAGAAAAEQQQHSGAVPTPQAQGQPLTPGERPSTPPPLGSPSVESVASLGAVTTASVASVATTSTVAGAGVVAMRRQAEELARWLDDKLGTLGVLEEALGIETR